MSLVTLKGIMPVAVLLLIITQTAFAESSADKSERHDQRNRAFLRFPHFGVQPYGFVYSGPPSGHNPSYLPYSGYTWPAVPYPYYAPSGHTGPYAENTPPGDGLPGYLIIITEPANSDVHVDGVALTQRGDLSFLATLLPGEHEVIVSAKGYRNYQKRIAVQASVGQFVAARLDRVK